MTEQSGPDRDEEFEIPVFDAVAAPGVDSGPEPSPDPAGAPGPAEPAPSGPGAAAEPAAGESEDWTRTDPVRDDPGTRGEPGTRGGPGPREEPGTLGEEVRKLWEVVHGHFVDPVLRNYPEAAGHLTSAGFEVASAFRALVRGSEQRWTGAPPTGRGQDAGPDWDGRIVIGEDGGDNDDDTADRPKD